MPYLKPKEQDDAQGRIRPAGSAPLRSAPGMPAPAQPAPGAGSGDWTNISRYIDANKEVSDRTAGEFAGKLEQEARGAKASVDDAKNQFEQDAVAGAWNEGRAGEDPGEAAYKGPQNMAEHRGFADLSSKVNETQSRVKTATTGYGMQAHMQDRYGGSGNYTGGQSSLDAALVGGAGGKRFHQLGQQYGGLKGYLDSANKESAALSQSVAFQSDQMRTDWNANAAARAAAEEAAAKKAAEDAAYAAQQASMRDNAGRGDLQNTTVSINDEKAAMNDDTYYEWLKAGSPPYDAWKASRGG